MSESKNGEALKYIRTVVATATAAGFTARNPTLLKGQLGYETDTKKLKVGTGSTVWTSLAYVTLGGVATPASHVHPVADISDMSANARTFNQQANYAAMLAALGAAAASHTHTSAAITDATAVGIQFLTITTPAGVRFARINADGTITLRTAAELASDIGAAGVSDGDKGDITVSSGGTVWTVDNGLALSKLEQIDEAQFVGRRVGTGTGAPGPVDADQASTMLDTASDPFLRTSAASGSGLTHPQVMARAQFAAAF